MALRCALLAFVAALAGCSPGSEAGAGGRDAGKDAAPDVIADAAPEAPAKDAADDSYGSDWDAGSVLSDPAIWTPVPDNGGCGLYVAKVVPDPFPKRQWTACGTGCEVSDAPMTGLGDNGVLWGSVTASERDGDIYYRAGYDGMFASASPIHVMLTSRLGDGASIAAVEERNYKCTANGWGNDAAFVFPVSQGDKNRGGVISGAGPGAGVKWGHWLSAAGFLGGTFSWDDGWGIGMNGALYVNTSPDQTAFQVIQSGNPFETYGRGKLVVWYANEGGPQNAIKSYTVSGGIKTLVTVAQGTVWSVALSADKMAWIVVDGLHPATYHFDSASLYWSPVATDPKDVQVHGPVTLPVTPNEGELVELRVGGDYVASKGCWQTDPTTGECPIFVIQLSTSKIWQIPPRPASAYWDVMAVSQDEILAGETNMPNQAAADSQYVRRFVRFKTADLDALQNGW